MGDSSAAGDQQRRGAPANRRARTPRPPSAAALAREHARRVPTPKVLAERLATACGMSAPHRVEVPMTAAATAVASLGAGVELASGLMAHLADLTDPAPVLTRLWSEIVAAHPYLDGHLDALLGWTFDVAAAEDVSAFRRCAAVLVELDLGATMGQPRVDGDLFGPLLMHLRSRARHADLGAFFTPMSVCRALALMGDLAERESFAEPCCGTGTMAVAVARVMRDAGRDPARVRFWHLNDVDPLSVALAGVNAAAHGFGPNVTLTCADGLRATGGPGDPFVASGG